MIMDTIWQFLCIGCPLKRFRAPLKEFGVDVRQTGPYKNNVAAVSIKCGSISKVSFSFRGLPIWQRGCTAIRGMTFGPIINTRTVPDPLGKTRHVEHGMCSKFDLGYEVKCFR